MTAAPAEDGQHLRFRVGDFACLAVSDGALPCGPPEVPGQVLCANAPAAELEAAVRESGGVTPWTHWTEQITCVLADTGAQLVLIDAGAGALDPATGRLAGDLAAAGVMPQDIDAVILSLGHADHVGGLMGPDGSPRFPRARVLLSRREWSFWMDGEARRALSEDTGAFLAEFAARTLPLVRDRLEFLDGDEVPFAGVRCLPAPGHTPGHLVVELSSGSERCLVVGDLIVHALHVVHPGWYTVFDADPVELAQTREAVLARAAASGCLVHVSHFPFPGLGRVRVGRAGFVWHGAA